MSDQCIPLPEGIILLRFQAFVQGVLNYINGQSDCSNSDCISTDGVRDHIVRRFETQELISWFGMALVALMALYFTLPHQQRQMESNRNGKPNNTDDSGPHDDGHAN